MLQIERTPSNSADHVLESPKLSVLGNDCCSYSLDTNTHHRPAGSIMNVDCCGYPSVEKAPSPKDRVQALQAIMGLAYTARGR